MSNKGVQLSRFRELLSESQQLRRQQVTSEGLSPGQHRLATWQADRLAYAYRDLESQSRYRLAVEFFLSDIYGPKDFTQRDEDVERIYPMMSRVLSATAIESMTRALELHALSQRLDGEMVAALERAGVTEIDGAAWAAAYLEVGDREARERQITLVMELGKLLDSVVANPLIYAAIKVARGPAHAMGFGELQDFVERGFVAFRHMHGADRFLGAVRDRELAIHHRLMAGEPPSRWFMAGDALERDLAEADPGEAAG